MNYCKACGNVIDDAPGLKGCPACAIRNILQGDWDYLQPPLELPSREFSPIFSGLRMREDFFKKYQIVEAIDDGGQGKVWKVWDYEFRRTLAMKGLKDESVLVESACYRFLAEAQITSQLKHPGILPVYDAGLDFEGNPFYTTELLSGSRLDRKCLDLKKKAWTKTSFNVALELIIRICEIMGHVHSKGVIHRDLKPSNVMVGEFGDVRVIDWGSAAILKDHSEEIEQPFISFEPSYIQTDRQEILGKRPDLSTSLGGRPFTPVFTPPELLAGQTEQTGPETDVYAVGVMLYELLTGQLPFIGDGRKLTDADMKLRILFSAPPSVLTLSPMQSRDLAAITDKAMAREKNSRYHSMQELAEDIRAAIELRPVKARNPDVLLKTQRFIQRNLAVVVPLGIALVIAAVSFATVRGVEAQKRVSRQVQALENADIARRNGRWREDLKYIDEAEQNGYGDAVALGLRRAEAWTVLNEPSWSKRELEKLANCSGKQRGVVLLRTGEHYLFDAQTAVKGIELIKDAQREGLDPADEALAKGLLAPSSAESLDFFRQALILDPYLYGAHIRMLDLEYLLGLRQDLETECHIFKILYPDDPSPTILKAFDVAMDGRLKDAQVMLNLLNDQTPTETLRQMYTDCSQIYVMAQFLNVSNFLSSSQSNLARNSFEIIPFISQDRPAAACSVRMPYLPCIAQGLIESYTGIRSLALPFLSEPGSAVQRIKSGFLRYREALPPFLGGLLLERKRLGLAENRQLLDSLEADLFEMSANSSSIFPSVPRLARFMAARIEFEQTKGATAQREAAAQACLKNVREASAKGGCSAQELSAYFDFAFSLKNYDLARALLAQWEILDAQNNLVLRKQIELEMAVNSPHDAQLRLAKILTRDPSNSWALAQKAVLLKLIKQNASGFQ